VESGQLIRHVRPQRGLIAAIAATLPGGTRQRCQTHYLRDLLTKVTKSSHGRPVPSRQ
jgi:transposase-like protein